jgi:hypothetical protein
MEKGMTNEEVRELGALYALGALDEASSRDLEMVLDRLPEDFDGRSSAGEKSSVCCP